MLSQVPIYKIRVHYKGGTTEEYEVLEITTETRNGELEKANWKLVDGSIIRPIYLGIGNIAAIYQVGVRNG